MMAIWLQQGGYTSAHSKDAQDLALIFASVEVPVAVFFSGSAVLSLRTLDSSHVHSQKNPNKGFGLFALYDIEQCYVDQQALEDFGLHAADLKLSCTVLNSSAFYQQLAQCQHVLSV